MHSSTHSGTPAQRAIGDLALYVAAPTGSEIGQARCELMERLSVALCRGNYRLLSADRVSGDPGLGHEK